MKHRKPHIVKRKGQWQAKVRHGALIRTYKPSHDIVGAWLNMVDKVKA
jgi:hypothetical protein